MNRENKNISAQPGPESQTTHAQFFGVAVNIRLALALIFFAAAALRILYLFDVHDQVFFRQLLIDQASYDEWAKSIVAGDWLGKQAFYQDPLYPYFLAILYSIFGRNLVAVYVIQILLSSLCVLPMYGLGKRLFNDPRVGLLAALFWAGYKVSFFFDVQILKTSPGMALLIAWLWLMAVMRDRPGFWASLFAGLTSGLLFVFRGNFLAVVPLIMIWLFYVLWKQMRARALVLITVMGLVCFLILGAVAYRNYLTSGEFVLTTAQGGVNFYVGNYRENEWGAGHDPDFARRTPVFEQSDFAAEARRRTGRELSPSELDRFWYKEGISEIKADPGLFFERLGRKMLIILNRHEVSDNLNYDFFIDYFSWMLKLPLPAFWLAGPFGIAGMALSLQRKKGGMLALYLAAYTATLLAFYVVGRYRLPLVPALLVFAAFGLLEITDAIKSKNRKTIMLYLGSLVVFTGLAFPEWQSPSYDDSWQKMGHAFLREGNFQEAIQAYEKSLAINPGQCQARLGMAVALERRNRWEEALPAFAKAAACDPDHAAGRFLYGRALERKGRIREAIHEYEKALEYDPENGDAKKALQRIKGRVGSD